MQNAKAQTPDMRIAPSAQHDWDAILVELCEQGFVRIPAFLSPEKCAAVQKGILDALGVMSGPTSVATRIVLSGSAPMSIFCRYIK